MPPSSASSEVGLRPESDAVMASLAIAQRIARDEALRGRLTSKGGRDLVTAADVAVEDAVRAELLQRWPELPVVGEERGGVPPADGGPYWLLDPICGTRAFASRLPLYCTNLALVEDGEVVLSGVAEGGVEGRTFIAQRGSGAWELHNNGLTPIRASDSTPIVCCDANGTRSGPWTADAARFMSRALESDRWYVWMLPTTLPYAYVATGRVAAVVQFGAISPVHYAAGCALAEAAGACVTDHGGRPWSVRSTGLHAAASPGLHAELMRLMERTRA